MVEVRPDKVAPAADIIDGATDAGANVIEAVFEVE